MIVYKNEITKSYCCGNEVKKIVACGNVVFEKQEPTPPTPTNLKWGFTDMSGITHSYPCDGNSVLTRDDITDALDGLFVDPALDNYYIHSAWVGDCTTTISANTFNNFFDMSGITLHDGITTIEHSVFKNTDIRSIAIPSATTTISDNLFSGCKNLSAITLHDGITMIGSESFIDCYSLTSITIPSSVTRIRDTAFYLVYDANDPRCINALANRVVVMQGTTPPTLGAGNVFAGGIRATYKIYVPSSALEAYRESSTWSPYVERLEPY